MSSRGAARVPLVALFVFASPIVACDGGPGDPSADNHVATDGARTIRVEDALGGALSGCPDADGTIVDTVISLDLGTRAADRTETAIVCQGSGVPQGGYMTTSTTISATATTDQVTALTNAIGALTTYPSGGCGADGDGVTLTISGETTDTYETSFDTDCAAGKPVVDDTAMSGVFSLAAQIF